jgi:hypothetical protein
MRRRAFSIVKRGGARDGAGAIEEEELCVCERVCGRREEKKKRRRRRKAEEKRSRAPLFRAQSLKLNPSRRRQLIQ